MINFKKWVSIDSWTNIDKTLEQRNNVLVSIFAIFGIITSIVQFFNDLYHLALIPVGIDLLIIIILIIVYFLNERRKHLLAKTSFLVAINLIIFVYAAIVPKEIGTYFIFFPIIAISTVIFNKEEFRIRNILLIVPFVALIILETTNYQPFGQINIQEGIEDNSSFVINLLASLAVLIIALMYLSKISWEISDKREQIARELHGSNESLKKTNAELDHFVYSTSHDLKAPLSSIQGLINIAKYEVNESKAIEYFDLINGRINKLDFFIKDIIDLSRNSRLEVIKEQVNPLELITNVLENNRYMSGAKSIDFKTSDVTNEIIVLDRARIEVLLNNLISNAIKYHKNEGDRFVHISFKKGKENAVIIIEDNGSGIEEAHQNKIFDMFYRANESAEGSGLGLYIVKDVINKMDGSITFTSSVQKGTKFTITIPI